MNLLEKNLETLPADAVLMGMDIGKKTIGIAISDSAHSIAFPICTINRTKFSKDLRKLEDIIREYDVGGYIVGYPLNMDNSEGRACQSIRDFTIEFSNQLSPYLKGDSLWVSFWDERLSTASVHDFVDNTVDISKRKAKERGIVDKLAAQHILQGALDFIQRSNP